ncbi:MAG: antibiotic biosynthesis monooxygenase family protein [Dongiaceae bacterium]
MILELATLGIRPGQSAEFERAFARAAPIIASVSGHLGHELQRCLVPAVAARCFNNAAHTVRAGGC